MKDISEIFRKVHARYQGLDAQGKIYVWAGGLALIVVVVGISLPKPSEPLREKKKEPALQTAVQKDENGYFLSEDVDRKAYVERLEAQYFSVAEKNQALA